MNKNLKQAVKNYKDSMVHIFKTKYNFTTYSARTWIIRYDFESILRKCNYIALHDDPEMWVDAIYQWKCSLAKK